MNKKTVMGNYIKHEKQMDYMRTLYKFQKKSANNPLKGEGWEVGSCASRPVERYFFTVFHVQKGDLTSFCIELSYYL
jgi:hypothetical protein